MSLFWKIAFISDSKQNFLIKLSEDLIQSYENNKQRYHRVSKKTGKSEFDAYYPAKSKDVLDKIDVILAQHYGFDDDELDYIINYDFKYRMGIDNLGD